MAPFKLKFRMGGGNSRSTSHEHDNDTQVNEALLDGASNSTIDSTDCNSLVSLGTNERNSLLPNKTNNLNLDYICSTQTDNNQTSNVPRTPPPSYEHVLEEDTRLNKNANSAKTNDQLSSYDAHSLNNYQSVINCFQNNVNQDHQGNNEYELSQQNNTYKDGNESSSSDQDNDYRKESIDSTEQLITVNMSSPTHAHEHAQEHAINSCTANDCNQFTENSTDGTQNGNTNSFCDPLMGCDGCSYCINENQYGDDCQQQISNDMSLAYVDENGDTVCDGDWNTSQMSSNNSQQQLQQQQQQQAELDAALTPTILSNKSSKEIYKDLAKQWGITCKMSDGCRCMECQSHYFDCEIDEEQSEHQKIDGGLGAGMPMFIGDVIHGSVCTIL